MKLLIANEDPAIRAAIALALLPTGAGIAFARGGNEVLCVLAARPDFDLVIVDATAPWMSGLQALAFARGAGVTAAAIVIAGPDPRLHVHAARIGARVLEMPFSRDELLAAVRLELLNHGDRLSDRRAARARVDVA